MTASADDPNAAGPPAADWANLRRHLTPLAPEPRRAQLRHDQRQRWLRGQRILVEAYLQHLGDLIDTELAIDLIAGERDLRQELGERPDVAEYQRRFPQLIEALDRTEDRGYTHADDTPADRVK
ncbi:MAG: hypothetical protein ACRD9W_12810, partial [Terriglobia bacterium]